MGLPSEPNAAGAVLANRATTAARMGLSPKVTRMTEVTAIGVPNPEIDSTIAPKQ